MEEPLTPKPFIAELDEWFTELDSRYMKKLERTNAKTPSKERRTGSSAKSIPPSGAPKWAVDQSWKNGKGEQDYLQKN